MYLKFNIVIIKLFERTQKKHLLHFFRLTRGFIPWKPYSIAPYSKTLTPLKNFQPVFYNSKTIELSVILLHWDTPFRPPVWIGNWCIAKHFKRTICFVMTYKMRYHEIVNLKFTIYSAALIWGWGWNHPCQQVLKSTSLTTYYAKERLTPLSR